MVTEILFWAFKNQNEYCLRCEDLKECVDRRKRFSSRSIHWFLKYRMSKLFNINSIIQDLKKTTRMLYHVLFFIAGRWSHELCSLYPWLWDYQNEKMNCKYKNQWIILYLSTFFHQLKLVVMFDLCVLFFLHCKIQFASSLQLSNYQIVELKTTHTDKKLILDTS